MNSTWDCMVVGAGAAGLSAALVLGRARRTTLVIDAGGQSNRAAEGIGGLLGQDGRPPHEFYAHGRRELAKYPSVEVRDSTVVAAREGFVVELADGTVETARTLLLATGMEYRLPDVPGIAERWGRSVFHCPFCHGWEHRDEALAVLEVGGHRADLLRMWTDDVTEIDASLVSHVDGPGSTLTRIVFKDGSEHACTGLLVPVTLHQRTDLAVQLGAALAEPGPIAQDSIAVDGQFRTSVPGLFAAGHAAAAAMVADLMAARAVAKN